MPLPDQEPLQRLTRGAGGFQHLGADCIAPPAVGYAATERVEENSQEERVAEVNYLAGNVRHGDDHTPEQADVVTDGCRKITLGPRWAIPATALAPE